MQIAAESLAQAYRSSHERRRRSNCRPPTARWRSTKRRPTATRPGAVIIVIQEAFGVNDHIEDVARRFAEAGYHAVAPAIFHRAGGGVAPYDDFSKVMPLFEGLTDDGVLMDIDATLDAPARRGLRRRSDRHRRILLRWPGHVPRVARGAPSAQASASTAAGSRTTAREWPGPLAERGGVAADARGSGCSATRTR